METGVAYEVISALTRDYDGFRKSGNGWLRYGKCPSPDCGENQLYTKIDQPWRVKCGRSSCGFFLDTKEQYPHLFKSINERYKATNENPNATADAYMKHERGFDLKKIKGWYEQGDYFNPNADKGTATVKFYLNEEKTVFMERFVETVIVTDEKTKKKTKRPSRCKGEYTGLWWQPPTLTIEEDDYIWICEACMDAIALNLNGVKAIASISAGTYPTKLIEKYKDKNITWVWALDGDVAGRKETLKHVKEMRSQKLNVEAAQPSKEQSKVDWNDLHKKGELTPKDIENYEYYGSLLIAKSAIEKALLIYKTENINNFWFVYNRRMYWYALDLDKLDKIMKVLYNKEDADEKSEDELRDTALEQSGGTCRIANCSVNFLYYQKNEVIDEAWYYAQVDFPHYNNSTKMTFTGSQISASAEFKKRLISNAVGAMWRGNQNQLDRIVEDMTNDLKVVETIDYLGYSSEHKCYVFNNIAVKDGEVYKINHEDYFDMDKTSIKSLQKSIDLDININLESYNSSWPAMIQRCFGFRGMVNLAYWFGSFFAEQIREMHGSFPFLAMIGEPGTGKSTIIEFLWKCSGRANHEGFNPSSASKAALFRTIAQASNLPVVLMEGDRSETDSKYKGFEHNLLKPLYNGRSMAARGVKNSGTETYTPPFRGSVIIEQNNDIVADIAVLERLIQLLYTKEGQNAQTKAIADELRRIPMKEVSGFILKSVLNEHKVLAIVKDKFPVYLDILMNTDGIHSIRIAETHAQLMALVDAMATVIDMPESTINKTHEKIMECAIERQESINTDHPIVRDFWDTYEYLNPPTRNSEGLPILNHANDDKLIWINLNHFVKVAADHKQQVPSLQELKQHLKLSKSRKYIEQKTVASSIFYTKDSPNPNDDNKKKSIRCWVFKKEH